MAAEVSRRRLIFFGALLIAVVLVGAAFIFSPPHDHFAAIPLNGDASWYESYEPNGEIQDNDIFFHGIGNSISNAQQADIIFLGASRPLIALDPQLFEAFASEHHVRMFNMAFAGIMSDDFTLAVIRKWHLHPKLWVIDMAFTDNAAQSFFFGLSQEGSATAPSTASLIALMHYRWINAYWNVVRRNLVWRFQHATGKPNQNFYRSAVNGTWNVERLVGFTIGHPNMGPPGEKACPASVKEIDAAKRLSNEIGGAIVVTQVLSIFSCDNRVREIAAALSAPAFTVDQTQFSTFDAGGHLDGPSSKKYTQAFFAWFGQLPTFKAIASR